MNTRALLILAFGIFLAGCAALNVEWFMTHRKARFFVEIFGRDGARLVYIILGIAIGIGGFFAFRG